jgi:hypothetical protein
MNREIGIFYTDFPAASEILGENALRVSAAEI